MEIHSVDQILPLTQQTSNIYRGGLAEEEEICIKTSD